MHDTKNSKKGCATFRTIGRTPFFLAILILFVSFILVSCTSDQEAEQGTEARGGKKYGNVYRMNETEEPRTLDPVRLNDVASHHVVHQICDQLVDFDSSLVLQPELAERWEVSEDGLTYTYYLRKGIRFHDSPAFPDGKGREMNAHDVKFSFDRILDSRANTLGATYFLDKVKGAQEYFDATSAGNADAAKGVSGFRIVDEYTFAIDLIQPFAAFKYYPALGFTYVYPHEAVEKFGQDFFRNLVGTGAFMLESWKKDQELVLKRNPNYWQKDENGNQLPFLDGVTFSFIRDNKQQINQFKLGHLEECYRIPSEFITSVFQEDGSLTPEYAEFAIHKVPAFSIQYYGMLTTSDVFKDKRVRQAFNYAVDREKIIKFVLQDQANGPGNHGLVPPSMPNYPAASISGYNFNLEKARALLAEAGYPNGQGFPKVDLQYNAGGGRNTQVAEAVQEMLNKGLNIQVGLKLLDWTQHLESVEAGNAPFYRLGWVADYPDPENFLNLFYGKNIPPTGPSPINSTRYNNPEFDALFEKALRINDDAERFAVYAQAEQIAVNDAPMLWIFYDLDFRLVQPYVKGYSSNPMDRRDLKGVWFDYGTP